MRWSSRPRRPGWSASRSSTLRPLRERLVAERDAHELQRDADGHGDPLPAVQGVVARVVGDGVAREVRGADADRGQVDAAPREEELVLPAGDAEVQIVAGVDDD